MNLLATLGGTEIKRDDHPPLSNAYSPLLSSNVWKPASSRDLRHTAVFCGDFLILVHIFGGSRC